MMPALSVKNGQNDNGGNTMMPARFRIWLVVWWLGVWVARGGGGMFACLFVVVVFIGLVWFGFLLVFFFFFLLCFVFLSGMIKVSTTSKAYLRDGSDKTIVRASTLRMKLYIKLAVSSQTCTVTGPTDPMTKPPKYQLSNHIHPKHALSPDQPVLALTL